MPTIAAALLLLGALLATAGTFAFCACAKTHPDRETLRLTWLAARYGRRAALVGLALWVLAWPATGAPYALLLIFAAASVTASIITNGAPELMKWAPS